MSEYSRNQSTEGMSRKHRARINATRVVLSFLTERHGIHETPEPEPSRIPGQIGSVALPHELDIDMYRCAQPHLTQPVLLERTDTAQAAFVQVTDRLHGWTGDGEYL